MIKKNQKSVVRQTLRIFWRALKKYKFSAILSVVLISTGIILNSYVSPLIISKIINKIQSGVPENQLWAIFAPYIFGASALYILSELVIWRFGIWILWRLETKIYKDLYEMAFRKLINQSLTFHGKKMSGSLVSQARNFANSFTIFFDTTIFNVLRILIGVIAIMIILTPIVPLYTAGLFVLAVIFTGFATGGMAKVSRAQVESTKQYSKLGGKFSDSVSNILAVKSNGQENFELEKIEAQGKIAFDAEMVFAKRVTFRDVGFGSVLAAGNIMIIFSAVFGNAWFGLSIGTLLLVMNYSQQLIGQLWDINRILRNYSKSFGDADEMVRMILEENSVLDAPNAKKLLVKKGEIEFRDVDFRHDGKPKSLFTDFNLKIEAGEKIGLVGGSGSGKSTLTKMILRFSDVESGEILIDGQNISKVTQKSLRENISYVPQESTLFNRTIAENIAYGKPGATKKEIIKAAKLANAWNFIKELPEGLETKVGDRGSQLSGGQRQRISIARAILKNAPILILDEATSALDTESEKLIQDALENLMKNRTSIVIAHRLSTIQKLDKIIVIDDGEIIESGTHDELLEMDAHYAKLWNIQAGIEAENEK